MTVQAPHNKQVSAGKNAPSDRQKKLANALRRNLLRRKRPSASAKEQ